MLAPGTALELKRKKCGLTQQEVADIVGISRNTLAAYESGKAKIQLSVFIRLADLYKCDVYDIFGVHAENMEYDIPVIELAYAHARYRVNENRKIDDLAGIQASEAYYDMKYKEYCEEAEKQTYR